MRNSRLLRLRLASIPVLFIGLVFIARLYNLQIQHGSEYASEGEKQYVSTSGNTYERGKIYMMNKDGERLEVANIAQGWMLTVNPQLLGNLSDIEKQIAAIYPDFPYEDFMTKAADKQLKYVEIAHRIPDDLGMQISGLHIPGVQLFRETWRTYPGGDIGGQVIGFVGHQGDDFTGQYGIERYYNEALTRNEDNIKVNYFAELFGSIKNVVYDRKEEERGDIVLTIEPTVQSQLEHTLSTIIQEWHSEQVGGIVMDAKTGAIYAMAANPTFNLNEYGKVKDISVFRNPLVEDVFEMGSIMKALTMASGLDAGVITPTSTYDDVGTMKLNGRTFSNFDGRARGPNTPVQEILNQSLNIGAAHVSLLLGRDLFKDYFLNKFQLGQETGIDLPGEAHGLISTFASKRDIETATASFGQGFAVSPINAIVALASLGNGGYLVTPHVMQEIVYNNGTIRKIVPPTPVPILKPGTSEEISRMLTTVVDKALFHGKARIPGYTVASKSGTAQMARSDGKGYEKDKYLHTFVAYAPSFNPRFIVFFFNKDPKNVDYASQTLGQPAMDLVKFLLNYYNVTPDRPEELNKSLLPKERQVAPAPPVVVPNQEKNSTTTTQSATT